MSVISSRTSMQNKVDYYSDNPISNKVFSTNFFSAKTLGSVFYTFFNTVGNTENKGSKAQASGV